MRASHHYIFQRNKRPIHFYVTRNPFYSGWPLLPTVEQFLSFTRCDTRRQDELEQIAGNLYEYLYDALNASVLAEWGYPELNEFIPRVVTFIDECGPQVCLVWKRDQDYGVMFVASRVAVRWIDDNGAYYADRS